MASRVALGVAHAAWATFVAGCAADPPTLGSWEAKDSAGVRVVTSYEQSEPTGTWAIEPEPRVRLGLRDDVAAEHFLGIRRVRVRSDGSVAVLDGSSAELRLFDPSGGRARVVAGRGEGPGELRGPRELHVLAADTMWVWDGRPGLSVFSADGDFVVREMVDAVGIRSHMQDRMTIGYRGLPDGTVLAVGYAPPRNSVSRIRNRMLYARAARDGSRLDTLGPSLDREWWVSPSGQVRGRTLLGPQSLWGAGGDPMRVALADSGLPEVRLYDGAGNLTLIVRFPGIDRSVPPAALRAAENARRSLPVSGPNLERFLAEAPEPAAIPAMGGLVIDGTGHLWVLPYVPDEGAAEWDGSGPVHVFDPAGRLFQAIQLPPGLEVHDVGEDWVAGVSRTEMGVEVVQVHALRRG